jgi:hypothetical protein
MTSCGWKKYWDHWEAYAQPMGVDPYLQDTPLTKRFRLLSGFAMRVRSGYYGNGNQVKNCTVSSMITAIGQTITLTCDANLTKIMGSECLLPHLHIMLDGYRKVNPPTCKNLLMQTDVPEFLVKQAYQSSMTECQWATAASR